MSIARAAAAPIHITISQTARSGSLMKPRLLPIVITVACAHGLALWALQRGLVRPSPVIFAPVVMVADLIELARPEAATIPPPAPPQHKAPIPRPAPAQPKPALQPVPRPVAVPAPTAPIMAPAASSEAPPSDASASPPSAAATPAAASTPPAPAKVELPSSNARYLNNPPPPYPPLSKRMGEQGRVVVRAFIDVNGTASQASITSSSGYERLDQVALKTVLQWRYVPGKRAGIPESMWFNVPLNFVLE